MSTVNPSAMLAESLSDFSKAAYQAFSEVEAQARMEVARSVAETREAKIERDNAVKELHLCQLEVQSWKQEAAASKAALAQADLTIAHQGETLTSHLEMIAQLRREVTQWKDQSRNWQEHFLRVEQERCTQASRIDELVVERLQYPSSRPAALFTPKATKYNNGISSAPSTTSSKHPHSPTQPPPYNPATLPSPTDIEPVVDVPRGQGSTNSQRRTKVTKPPKAVVPQSERDIPSLHANGELDPDDSSAPKRPRKSNPTVSSGQKSDHPAQSTVRPPTIIRRVQAVVHVKREEDSEDESPVAGSSTRRPSVSIKKKEESVDQQRHLRAPRPKIISDDVDDEVVERSASVSDSERGQRNRQQPQEKIRLRQRSRINYREEDDDDEEEDELMLGAEDNHDEVYGTHPVEPQDSRTSKQAAAGPPPKKRKLATR